MNLMHLKYAIEIAKAGSLNKAAENLCVGQPNLSRAIKELESSLGITIFRRSTKGMVPTMQGEEFLMYAKRALREIDEIENLYKTGAPPKQEFSVSVPRASYIALAFAEFSKCINNDEPAEIFYKETNAQRAIKNILESDYHLGIVRFSEKNSYYFTQMLDEKGLAGDTVTDFTYKIVMSKNHPLAKKDNIRFSDLEPFTEIAHADPYVPSLPMSAVRKEELPDNVQRRIFVFERASQFELLSTNFNTFMWVSPVPKQVLDRFGLVEKSCADNTKVYRDMLIYRKSYSLSDLDKKFIEKLCKAKKEFVG